jgi:hypothetical protein
VDVRSWPKKWNDASLRQFATLPEFSPSPRPWPMLGMLALGLVAGVAIGGYTASQRSHMKRLAGYTHRMGDGLAEMSTDEVGRPPAATRSNHRRKAAAEV